MTGMKILLLHTDFMEWEPKKKALKSAEDVKKGKVRVPEALVSLTSVEAGDEKDPEGVAKRTVQEILSVFRQVKAKNIVLYPYVHLSQNPAKPDTALKILKGMEKELKGKKMPVKRAPFGYYKAFDLKCKGHPLSELSREILPEGGQARKGGNVKEEVPEAVRKEAQLKSQWLILEPNGKTHKIGIKDGKISGFDFSRHPKLEKLCLYEMAKSRLVKQEPPHIKLMRRLQLADYEDASDSGHFRFLPKGRLIKSLLEDFVTKKMIDYGAMEVETPIMYNYEHPALKDYLNRFPARQYTIETPNKRMFLRFAACFGSFLLLHDSNISYRNLPLRIYEMTRYSFRVEQRGELAGLRRLRSFSMSDCHALCADFKQVEEELIRRFNVSKEIQNSIGLKVPDDFEFSIRLVKDFYKEHKKFVNKIVKMMGKPVLMEVWDKKFFYFIFKYEWNFLDALDKASCLTTDQIDIENAKRYEIRFTDKDNTKKYPLILHLSPSGSIERVMYALLEKAHIEHKAGGNPVFPLWLSPTQVRLCPVNESFIRDCEKIAENLEKECIRVDIDDRVEAVGKKIRDSEVEWVPMTVVLGEREKKSGKLAVRFRETGKVKNLSKDDLVKIIKKQTRGMPFKKLSLPRLLTRRPTFIG